MRSLVLVAAVMLGFPAAASAQSSSVPTTEDLVRQLKPGGVALTRGIKRLADTPQAAPARPAQGTVDLSVQFDSGSDRLTPAAVKMLDALGRALATSDLASYRSRIEGHTDTVGSPDYNDALSTRRAAAANDVVGRHGVERARLTAVGMGQRELLIATPEGVAEARNRRVRIINIGS